MSDPIFASLDKHPDYPDILVVIGYLSLFAITGTIGNAFVLYVFSKKTDKSTTTLFILVLAGTDLFTCLIVIPYTIYFEIIAKKVDNDLVCKMYQFLITSNVPFSAFIIVIIAFDRYFKICRPWNHILDVYVAKKTVIALLFFAISLGIVTAMTHGVTLNEEVNNTSIKAFVNGKVLNQSSSVTHLSGYVNQSSWDLFNDKSLLEGNTTSVNSRHMQTLGMSDNNASNTDIYSLCLPNYDYFSMQFVLAYQKCYAALFLISFLLVAILYSLIFRTISFRRSKKTQRALLNGGTRRTSDNLHTLTHTCTVTTRLTTSENGEIETQRTSDKQISEFQRKRKDRNKSIRVKQRLANVKTAGILFIVTAVFIVAFLPAWLMAIKLVSPNIIIFYMYYIYHVANPIIYAFFNITFRKEMREVLNCR